MKSTSLMCILLSLGILISGCVSKKEYASLQTQLDAAKSDLKKCDVSLNDYMTKLSNCETAKAEMAQAAKSQDEILKIREEQIAKLEKQLEQQITQVGDLTVLSQSANDNIKETLSQLEGKDKYIQLLQAARTKADSINLALAVNLKGALADGIEDEDVNVQVDKTVVMINLSDKMLFTSGKSSLTPRAKEVLGKIATIIESRPDLEVMVEGYTDNVPISSKCTPDNWALSVQRSAAVVRVLQEDYEIDPNRLIAAGRGEYNALASNETAEGRAKNRRTRIIIMPKLNQFYDLLNPNEVPD
ncbi:MAG: OmpA family protein [Bacteroidota bacterium]